MATNVTNPLTDEHCECIDKVLASTAEALELARQCKECGLDVQQLEATLRAQQRMATNLKAKFFPNNP